MIFRTPAGEIGEDRAAPGWWIARPRTDATFTAGFRDRFLALSWLQAVADAECAGLPRPRLPAASTAPLFAPAPYRHVG